MDWMGPSQELRLKWEISGRACTWNPVLPTLPLLRMPHRSLRLILILFLCFIIEWICKWDKSHKTMKHVSNLKTLSLTHFILVFKNHRQDYLPSDGSWQTCVMLCYYLCSISCSMHHANIPFKDDTFFFYTICIGGSNQRPADKGGCPSLQVCLLYTHNLETKSVHLCLFICHWLLSCWKFPFLSQVCTFTQPLNI